MLARIYQPVKTAMQSGRARTRRWILEFEPNAEIRLDPLMGWSGSTDTTRQVKMPFDTIELAIAFAEKHGIPYEVRDPHGRTIKPRAYADNFRYERPDRAV